MSSAATGACRPSPKGRINLPSFAMLRPLKEAGFRKKRRADVRGADVGQLQNAFRQPMLERQTRFAPVMAPADRFQVQEVAQDHVGPSASRRSDLSSRRCANLRTGKSRSSKLLDHWGARLSCGSGDEHDWFRHRSCPLCDSFG